MSVFARWRRVGGGGGGGRLGGTWEGELMMLRQQYGNRLVAEYYAITKPVVTVTNSTE